MNTRYGPSVHKGLDQKILFRLQIHIFPLGIFEIRTFDLSIMTAYDIGTRRKSEMAGFIEELFYGNIDPQARSATHNAAVQKEMQTLSDYEEEMTNQLTGEDKKKFLAYVNAWGVVNGEGNLDSFIVGFRLGAALMQDTFLSDKAPYTDYLKEE